MPQLALVDASPSQETVPPVATATDELLLDEFRTRGHVRAGLRRAAPGHGVRAVDVRDVETFSRLCPLLSKVNTFDRFPLAELTVGGRLHDVGEVLTSSGHGGRFSFGVISRERGGGQRVVHRRGPGRGVRVKSKDAGHQLPADGRRVTSDCMTVATTSVREDMAVALVEDLRRDYDQILLVGDPLFMKRLTITPRERMDWRRHRVGVVLGEEIFGEHFRRYIGDCLGLEPEPGGGYIMSSFGVGELGLHLCFETPRPARLARAVRRSPRSRATCWAREAARTPLPMIFAFNPQRTFIEV